MNYVTNASCIINYLRNCLTQNRNVLIYYDRMRCKWLILKQQNTSVFMRKSSLNENVTVD